jgi:hypothetical protein
MNCRELLRTQDFAMRYFNADQCAHAPAIRTLGILSIKQASVLFALFIAAALLLAAPVPHAYTLVKCEGCRCQLRVDPTGQAWGDMQR